MKYETLEIQIKDDVVTVSLNRPEVHNAMNEKLMKELTDFFTEISEDDNIRIVILTGNGKSFCAGADLNWMKSMANYDKQENIKDSRLLSKLFESIYNCPKPTIAKINGHAFGGGLGLFAVCDIAIAIPDCKFAFSEVKLGIIPSVISTYIVRRLSLADMRRLFLTGERFSSDYAHSIGLIDFVFNEEDIEKRIEKYIGIFRSSGPTAIKEIKKLVDACEVLERKKYIEHTIEKISELRVSEEGQEGINAFLNKRKSKWSG
jgi:methylglutaconyl-CoA hydratase